MKTLLPVFACCAAAFAQPALQKQIAAIAADARGQVSVACSLPGTDLNCDLHPHAHPPMQSVFGSPQEFDCSRILGRFLEDHEFGPGCSHALSLQ